MHDVQTAKKTFSFLHLDDAAQKRVSYILITKNRAQELEKKLVSVHDLLESDDELIVIDGASGDSTRDVVERHKDIVAIFLSEPDVNSAHAINKGMMLASGRYIHLLFDDDVTHRDGIRQAVALMDDHTDIDLLVCGGMKHFVARNFSRPFYYRKGMGYGMRVEDAFRYGTCANGFLIRRSSLAKVGLFPLDALANDNAFMAQCIYNGGIVRFARINLFDHIISEKSFSVIRRKDQIEERERLRERYCPPSFFVKRRLKKMWVIRMLGLFWISAMIARFVAVAREKGLWGALRRVGELVQMRGKELETQQASEPIWDGGIS